jgi:hypothetical protein
MSTTINVTSESATALSDALISEIHTLGTAAMDELSERLGGGSPNLIHDALWKLHTIGHLTSALAIAHAVTEDNQKDAA